MWAQHSGHVGYNVQSVVDAETHLIVAHEVTNQGHDRDQLASMAGAAKTALRRDDLHILADKGYFSGGEILACYERLVWPIGFRGVPPAQPVAIYEDNPAQYASIIDAGLAVRLWKKGGKTRQLRIRQPEKIRHGHRSIFEP
ncbi:Transposase DDE domain-containing protein [Paracoccus denitrificans]|jgi:hypothetical protein|uniref:Transposase IS4-like domain-containing protein n=1 Tax=Paracoccus denitrificans (strain Pd 1222) TaxID=318586 RepID=A1B4P9_PARDP|nr:hypothetical protein Pden_2405 [Paracoccus denitrificans PD1222]MBB4629698.1 hypothetical protein [Paracoccus denitrificans]GEK71415.1 hypothetical protein PDE01_49350 [Paracoccus denitrificans]SDJ93242.1 Transposase DDE domain-containing protein [Paracoccus denitrificans]SFR23240.1 Transposase DDE domain-containing protein [Paracoccus denitrificans]